MKRLVWRQGATSLPPFFLEVYYGYGKCVKDESHSEFTKEEQEEFLNLLGRITPEQREALKKVLKSFT